MGREVGQTGQDMLFILGLILLAVSALLLLVMVRGTAPGVWLARAAGRFGSFSRHRWMLSVFCLAVVLRLIWVAVCPVVQFSDFKGYDDLAEGIRDSGTYCLGGRPSAIWPPGYPFLLAATYSIFGQDQFPAKIANVFLGGVLALGMYLLAREAGSESCARWASFMAAVYPPLVMTASLLASENLFIPLMIFGLIFFLRGCRENKIAFFALAGGLLGLAAMVRSGIYLLPILLALWLLCRRDGRFPFRAGAALLLIGCSLTVIFPWIWRNRLVFGHWGIMGTSLGWTFYDTNTNYPFPEKLGLQQSLSREKNDEYEVDRELFRRGLDFVGNHPGWFLRNLALGKARSYLLGSPEWLSQYNLKRNPDWPSRRLNLLYFVMWALNSVSYYLLLLLTLAGIFSGFGRSRYSFLFLLLIGYNLGLLIVSKGLPRYRLAVIPIFIFFAALFMENLSARLKVWFTYRHVEHVEGSVKLDTRNSNSSNTVVL